MGSDDQKLRIVSTHGVVAPHPAQDPEPLLVAPTTGAEFNTLGLGLIPVACVQLADILFEFDSSFVRPDVEHILGQIPALREARRNSQGKLPPLSIFGHADPVGDDEYNKHLSGRRAKSVFGLLTHRVQLWESLFDQSFGGDDWKARNVSQTMRTRLGPGAPSARTDLIKAYMAALFPDALGKADFLARDSDPKGKGDMQGCSEFNLLMSLSQDENSSLSIEKRNRENQPNRRVVIYLFRPGSQITPKLWPCPNVDEPTAGCRKRFFVTPPKGDDRRKAGPERREHDALKDTTADTFACRFYDQIAHLSPCERKVRVFRIRVFDLRGFPVPNAPYLASEGTPAHGTATPTGDITLADVEVPSTCTLFWSRPDNFQGSVAPDANPTGEQFEFSMKVFVDVEDADLVRSGETLDARHQAAQRRLHNLGFAKTDSLAGDIRLFQREFGAAETGKLDDVESVLNQRHLAADPPSRYTKSGGPSLPPEPPQTPGPIVPDPLPEPDPIEG